MIETTDQKEKTRRLKAWLFTLAVHAIALILFLIFGLKEPVPLPEEQGASIEFGWDDAASGPSVADVQSPQPQPQQTREQAPEESVEETPEEEVVTDENSDIAVPDTKAEKEKQKEKPKPKPKPETKPKEEPKPTISNELSNALDALNKKSGGGSQGDTEGIGDQGNPQGTTGKGALGGGSGSWQLDGRSMLPGYGTKIEDTKEEGILVLNIWVNRDGKVTKVQPNLRESNTTSQYLINLAKNDVLNNFRFNGDPSAAVEQRGKVRYVFQLK